MAYIAIVNGPNLNLLGKRQPEIYGTTSMQQVLLDIQRQWMDTEFRYFQSNHEGALIDFLQTLDTQSCSGVVINAAGLTHTSVALRDTVEYLSEMGMPVVEVHISNIAMREPFRQQSLLSDVVAHSIIGQGVKGYLLAVQWLKK